MQGSLFSGRSPPPAHHHMLYVSHVTFACCPNPRLPHLLVPANTPRTKEQMNTRAAWWASKACLTAAEMRQDADECVDNGPEEELPPDSESKSRNCSNEHMP